MSTLVLELRKKIENDNETRYSTFYLSSKTEAIINGTDTDDAIESIYGTTISKIQKRLGKG